MRGAVVGLALAFALCPGAARAQAPVHHGQRGYSEVREVRSGHVGGGLILGVPVGEFQNFVNVGGGLGGFLLVNLDERGAFGIRLDASFLIYGSETRRRPFSQTIQLIQLDVTTSNQIISLAVGPQFSAARGAVRPYVNGGIGFSYFATVSSVRGSSDVEDFANTTNFDDFTFAALGGAGVWIPVSRGPTSVSIDLSARYVRNGRVRYLREGSIREAPDGAISFAPIESETNLLVYQIGVSVGGSAGRKP